MDKRYCKYLFVVHYTIKLTPSVNKNVSLCAEMNDYCILFFLITPVVILVIINDKQSDESCYNRFGSMFVYNVIHLTPDVVEIDFEEIDISSL